MEEELLEEVDRDFGNARHGMREVMRLGAWMLAPGEVSVVGLPACSVRWRGLGSRDFNRLACDLSVETMIEELDRGAIGRCRAGPVPGMSCRHSRRGTGGRGPWRTPWSTPGKASESL